MNELKFCSLRPFPMDSGFSPTKVCILRRPLIFALVGLPKPVYVIINTLKL